MLSGSPGESCRGQRRNGDGQTKAEYEHGRKHVDTYDAPCPIRVMPATPKAHNNGPTAMGGRGPTRCARSPVRDESSNKMRVVGSSATPAASGL